MRLKGVKPEKEFIPDPETAEIYDEMYEIYRGLYESERETFRKLGELREKRETVG